MTNKTRYELLLVLFFITIISWIGYVCLSVQFWIDGILDSSYLFVLNFPHSFISFIPSLGPIKPSLGPVWLSNHFNLNLKDLSFDVRVTLFSTGYSRFCPITMDVMMFALELLCYSGNMLSGMIARNIYRMPHKTLINKMFLGYFSIDCVIGIINPLFLIKLLKERFD